MAPDGTPVRLPSTAYLHTIPSPIIHAPHMLTFVQPDPAVLAMCLAADKKSKWFVSAAWGDMIEDDYAPHTAYLESYQYGGDVFAYLQWPGLHTKPRGFSDIVWWLTFQLFWIQAFNLSCPHISYLHASPCSLPWLRGGVCFHHEVRWYAVVTNARSQSMRAQNSDSDPIFVNNFTYPSVGKTMHYAFTSIFLDACVQDQRRHFCTRKSVQILYA